MQCVVRVVIVIGNPKDLRNIYETFKAGSDKILRIIEAEAGKLVCCKT